MGIVGRELVGFHGQRCDGALERCGSRGHLACARVIYMEGMNEESFVEEGKQFVQ